MVNFNKYIKENEVPHKKKKKKEKETYLKFLETNIQDIKKDFYFLKRHCFIFQEHWINVMSVTIKLTLLPYLEKTLEDRGKMTD